MSKRKDNTLTVYRMEKDFDKMQSLFDGEVLYDECLGEHIVAESVLHSPNLNVVLKDFDSGFQFISNCSEGFADFIVGLSYNTLGDMDTATTSKIVRGASAYERKLFAFLGLVPASCHISQVTNSSGEKKLRVIVHTTEKVDASIFTPIFKSKEVDYLILGKNFYSSVKKDGEKSDKKITF